LPGAEEPADALEARDLSRAFAGVQALDGVSLAVRPQRVVGLIGPNGAGKTTLINLLTGFDRPTSGAVRMGGQDITRWGPAKRSRHGLARTFQHGHLFADLTVRENVEVAGLGAGLPPRAARSRAAEVLGALGLERHADRPARVLTHGLQRKLGVARAVAPRPDFVLMDEPAAGLVEAEVPELAALVRSVADDHGAGVLLVDHNMNLVLEVCDHVHVLDRGRTLAQGTPSQIREDLDVTEAYLGGSGVGAHG
jgi:branched-chain amino acid transport system ATP-binding protein